MLVVRPRHSPVLPSPSAFSSSRGPDSSKPQPPRCTHALLLHFLCSPSAHVQSAPPPPPSPKQPGTAAIRPSALGSIPSWFCLCRAGVPNLIMITAQRWPLGTPSSTEVPHSKRRGRSCAVQGRVDGTIEGGGRERRGWGDRRGKTFILQRALADPRSLLQYPSLIGLKPLRVPVPPPLPLPPATHSHPADLQNALNGQM